MNVEARHGYAKVEDDDEWMKVVDDNKFRWMCYDRRGLLYPSESSLNLETCWRWWNRNFLEASGCGCRVSAAMTSTLNLLPMPSPSLAPSCSSQVARVTQALLPCRSSRRWLGRVALVDSKSWSHKGESASARRKKHGTMRVESSQATSEAAEHSGGGDGEEVAESAIGLSTLEQFIELNAGSWTGTFTVSKSSINRREFFFLAMLQTCSTTLKLFFNILS